MKGLFWIQLMKHVSVRDTSYLFLISIPSDTVKTHISVHLLCYSIYTLGFPDSSLGAHLLLDSLGLSIPQIHYNIGKQQLFSCIYETHSEFYQIKRQ